MNIRQYDEWDSSWTGRHIKPKPFNSKMSRNNVHGNKNKFEDKMNLAGHEFTITKVCIKWYDKDQQCHKRLNVNWEESSKMSHSGMEVSIQEFYHGMFLGLMPEESWWKKQDWTDGGGALQRVSTNP